MIDVRVWYTMFVTGRFIVDLYIFTSMVGSHRDLLQQKKVLTLSPEDCYGGDDYHFNSLRGSHFKSCTIFNDDFL